ncbi:hypothetical protein BKA69DRAFT_1036137 [Paraphysoderma sedebokerense]|nr:hypothetical protein BKA69DRAFT_1036137 [Paraphysoderma sedebokerense]
MAETKPSSHDTVLDLRSLNDIDKILVKYSSKISEKQKELNLPSLPSHSNIQQSQSLTTDSNLPKPKEETKPIHSTYETTISICAISNPTLSNPLSKGSSITNIDKPISSAQKLLNQKTTEQKLNSTATYLPIHQASATLSVTTNASSEQRINLKYSKPELLTERRPSRLEKWNIKNGMSGSGLRSCTNRNRKRVEKKFEPRKLGTSISDYLAKRGKNDGIREKDLITIHQLPVKSNKPKPGTLSYNGQTEDTDHWLEENQDDETLSENAFKISIDFLRPKSPIRFSNTRFSNIRWNPNFDRLHDPTATLSNENHPEMESQTRTDGKVDTSKVLQQTRDWHPPMAMDEETNPSEIGVLGQAVKYEIATDRSNSPLRLLPSRLHLRSPSLHHYQISCENDLSTSVQVPENRPSSSPSLTIPRSPVQFAAQFSPNLSNMISNQQNNSRPSSPERPDVLLLGNNADAEVTITIETQPHHPNLMGNDLSSNDSADDDIYIYCLPTSAAADGQVLPNVLAGTEISENIDLEVKSKEHQRPSTIKTAGSGRQRSSNNKHRVAFDSTVQDKNDIQDRRPKSNGPSSARKYFTSPGQSNSNATTGEDDSALSTSSVHIDDPGLEWSGESSESASSSLTDIRKESVPTTPNPNSLKLLRQKVDLFSYVAHWEGWTEIITNPNSDYHLFCMPQATDAEDDLKVIEQEMGRFGKFEPIPVELQFRRLYSMARLDMFDELLQLSEAVLRTRYTKIAIHAYSHLLRKRPTSWKCFCERAQLYESVDDQRAAMEDFKSVLKLDPTNCMALWKYAYFYMEKELWDDALDTLNRLLDIEGKNDKIFYLRAKAHSMMLHWDNALENLTIAIKINPRKAKYYTRRAFVYLKLQKYELALGDLIRLSELEPINAHNYLNMGIISMQHLEEYLQALYYFDTALNQDPLLLQAYLCRAELYRILHSESLITSFLGATIAMKLKRKSGEVGLLNKAIREYSKAIHLFPTDYQLYLRRGRLLLKESKIKAAIHDFQSAFELNSGIAQTFLQRAFILSFQGEYNVILREFERLSTPERNDPSLLVLIAQAKIQMNDTKGAYEAMNRASDLTESEPQIFLQRGICLQNMGDYTGAQAEFGKCIKVHPNFARAWYHRGACRLLMKDEDGIADICESIRLDPDYVDAYLSKATYLDEKGRYAEALEDCNEIVKLDPMCSRAYLLRGSLKCKLKQFGLALSDFTRCITLDPSAYRNRGLLYLMLEDYDNALRDFQMAVEQFPEDNGLKGLLGLCLHKLGKMSEAVEVFTKAIAMYTAAVENYLERGNILAHTGKFQGAKRDYVRCIHTDPSCMEAYINLGYIMQKSGKYNQAWACFTSAITRDPHCTIALEGRAVINILTGNYFAAMLDINKAIQVYSDEPELVTNRGVIHQYFGDFANALKDFKLAIRLNENYALAYFNAATMYFQQSSWKKALEYYDKAIQLNPTDIASLLNRGVTHSMLHDYDRAVSDFNVCLTLSTNPSFQARVYFNRAKVFENFGELSKAEDDFSNVLKLNPNDSSAYAKRGEIRGKLSNPQAAMADYQKYLSLKMESE